MARSLNRVQLIGNLTRDPELRYTPNGRPVCTFGIATNRNWTTETGEKKEEVEFHNIVAWGKLGELCSQFLAKGRKVFVEGRIATRSWTGQDGQQKLRTEIVIDDMIILDSKGAGSAGGAQQAHSGHDKGSESGDQGQGSHKATKGEENKEAASKSSSGDEDVSPDDIPF
jgi:single-strand DNA-binding protein